MNWYYQRDEKQVGPLSEGVIRELYDCGVVTDDTMVRTDNSGEWTSCQEAFSQETDPDEVTQTALETIEFSCPHCDQQISAEATEAGFAAQCPTCGGEIVVPQAPHVSEVKDIGTLGDPPETVGLSHAEKRARKQATIVEAAPSMVDRLKEGAKDGGQSRVFIGVFAAAALIVLVFAGLGLRGLVKSGSPDFTDKKWVERTFSEALAVNRLQERNSDGKLRYFLPNAENPVTGWVKEIAETSGTRDLIHLKSGIRDGGWASFYKDGQLRFRGTYKNGDKRGIQESWYENGQKESERLFEDSGFSVKVWKPNGEVCPETRVEGGNGKEIDYGDDGEPYMIVTYEDGKATMEYAQKEDQEKFNALFAIAHAINESTGTRSHGSGRKDSSIPKTQNQDYSGSPDFETGFRAGAIGSNLPFTNREAYLTGRPLGEKVESMPEYTQGYNQGKEHGLQKITMRSNPFNRISQNVEWLAWDHGYSTGNLEGQLSN